MEIRIKSPFYHKINVEYGDFNSYYKTCGTKVVIFYWEKRVPAVLLWVRLFLNMKSYRALLSIMFSTSRVTQFLSFHLIDMSSSSSSFENQSRFNPYRKRMYDVFISFKREDRRQLYISLLHGVLKRARVHVFVDGIELRSGDLFLSGAIEGSRVSIIVFTTNYVDSTRCLQELEKIMECRSSKGQVVVPVFYGVDPSEVRNQTGHFGEALASMERNSTNENEVNEVLSYRTALQEAAGISPRFVIDFR